MISSKLIWFFCFYLLLLFLDNSLGQKALATQVGNKELFKAAIDFGATFGGFLGLLGSQWKQILIQLVHAKRNVGFGNYQLARFNDSATTEEVGLAITDSYADKVAELVAVRVQDIGATQKYVDDLEILKNEIALTMIVEMDEIKKKFKEKNVREKVKEAKENGLTDTDIKELLFADYFASGGVSLIRAGASSPDALLSSFLKGMLSLLDETYDKELGIIQYGNFLGGLSFGQCFGKGKKDKDNNDARGGGGGKDGASGGGGNPGGAPGGGGGGDDRPPENFPRYRLPNGTVGDEDDQKPNDDSRIEADIDTFFWRFMTSLLPAESLERFRTPSPEDLEIWLLNRNGAGLGVEQGAAGSNEEEEITGYSPLPDYADEIANVMDARVAVYMTRRREQIDDFNLAIQVLQNERTNPFPDDEGLREPYYNQLSETDREQVFLTRIDYFENLINVARRLNSDLREYRIIFQRNYYRARDNFYFYAERVGWNLSRVPDNIREIYEPLSPLPEFTECDGDLERYLASLSHMRGTLANGRRLEIASRTLLTEMHELRKIVDDEEALFRFYKYRDPKKKS